MSMPIQSDGHGTRHRRSRTLYILSRVLGITATSALAYLTLSVLTDFPTADYASSATLSRWLVGGAALGALFAGLQPHPRRLLGWVAPGLTCLFAMLVWISLRDEIGQWMCLFVGLWYGVGVAPLLISWVDNLPADLRESRVGFLNTGGPAIAAVVLAIAFRALREWQPDLGLNGWLLSGVAAMGCAVAWWRLNREVIELFMEFLLSPFYRIRGYGPGLRQCPRRGPLLIVANHSSWFDPVWLGKVIPRRLTPMMTSSFYDLPVLKWVMVYVVRAIRVQDSTYRREAPELQVAISALDRGECVVIFPEGMLRRRDDRLVKQFGQGVWHILNQRPSTPVMVCWIEGGWGSYMSYYGGPPLVNKRMDWWRPIKIAASEPETLSAETLADDRVTRTYLMNRCVGARQWVGLPAPESELTANAT